MATAAIISEQAGDVKRRHDEDTMSPARYNRGVIDQETRDRVRAWIKYEMKRRDIDSIRVFAERIDVNHAYLSRVISGQQTAGLELVLRLHRKLHVSLDLMLDENPPSR